MTLSNFSEECLMDDSKIGKKRLKEIIEEAFRKPNPPEMQPLEPEDPPKDWKDLQVKVKEIYSNLGCDAKENITVKGARTKHKVDVFTVFEFGGQKYKIVVECKYWKSNVKKEQVATLLGILADIGAEKGIIVSKIGFQAGARRLASYTNVALVTYDELRRDSVYFVDRFRLSNALERLRVLKVPFSRFHGSMSEEAEKIGEFWVPSPEGWNLVGAISILKSRIEEIDELSFPRRFFFSFISSEKMKKEISKRVNSKKELLDCIIENVEILEKEFEELKDKIFSE